MAYNPEKTNANTSGNRPPQNKQLSEAEKRKLGQIAINGKK